MKAGNPIRLHITASCTVAGSVSAADRGLRHTLCDRCLPKNNRTMRGCKTADNANEKSVSRLNVRNSILPVPSGTYYFLNHCSSIPEKHYSHSTVQPETHGREKLPELCYWPVTLEWSLTALVTRAGVKSSAESRRIETIKAPIKKSLTVRYSRRTLNQTCS